VGVAGLKYNSHATFTKLFQDLVMPEHLSGHGIASATWSCNTEPRRTRNIQREYLGSNHQETYLYSHLLNKGKAIGNFNSRSTLPRQDFSAFALSPNDSYAIPIRQLTSTRRALFVPGAPIPHVQCFLEIGRQLQRALVIGQCFLILVRCHVEMPALPWLP
jgi:hypothetical protein